MDEADNDLALGQLFAGLRSEAGLSQRELAAKLGTTEEAVSQLEEGTGAALSIDALARVADALDRRLVVSLADRSLPVESPPDLAGPRSSRHARRPSTRPLRTAMGDVGRGLHNFWFDPAGRAILGVALTVIAIATIFYRYVEHLRWIDSLYFSVITVSTVGYGDIAPTTVASKIFTMVYVLVGIGVFVALVTTVAQHLIEAKHQRRASR
jgi:transcriptional regulator with XRE-family HTH domain